MKSLSWKFHWQCRSQAGRLLYTYCITITAAHSAEAKVPVGSPSCGGDATVYIGTEFIELAQSSLFCSCVYFCLYGPFHYIPFHKLSLKLSVFSLCSSVLISAILILSTIYLFMKVSFSAVECPRNINRLKNMTCVMMTCELTMTWR